MRKQRFVQFKFANCFGPYIHIQNRNSPKRDRSSSPMEMETDSESSEDEDGVITKDEEEEEKERKLILGSKHKPSKDGAESEQDETPATLEDLGTFFTLYLIV